MRIPEHINSILFDMDDVLVRTRPLDKEVKEKMIASLGLTWEQIEPYVHLTIKEMWPTIFAQYSIGKEPNDFAQQYFDIYNALLEEKLEVLTVPGVVELITKCSQRNYSLALVTSSTAAQAEIVMNGLRVKDFFDVVITSDDVTRGKPHPEAYQKAIKQLSTTPSKCTVIEDMPTGIQSAKAVSLETFVIAITTTRQREELHQADMIVDSFSELEL